MSTLAQGVNMSQLTIDEMMEIRRSIVKPHVYSRATIGGRRVWHRAGGDVSDEDFRWLKENHPYDTDLIIGYTLDYEYKLKNYNREQWQGMMDRDPDMERKVKLGRTRLLRSANHHYKDTDIRSMDEKFKRRVNTSFGDIEWYVSWFVDAYHPDRWYRPVWFRVREIVDNWE